ncbi:MAG TPA: hypothetical protein VKF40_08115 [Burkholderiales bacterium]|nr:hypothetical protein [Burkholderiales bacterium]
MGTKVVRRWLAAISAAAVMAGCGNGSDSGRNPAAGNTGGGAMRAPLQVMERDALRTRNDPGRNRTWVLTLEGVRIYDANSGRLVRMVALPNWIVARVMCQPDIVFDGSGAAIISSNLETKLWRIDADTFVVTEREIVLVGKEEWDTGFGALAYAPEGLLLALTSSAGSLWRVDLDKGIARMVEPAAPLSNKCELGIQPQGAFERRQEP